MTVVCELAVVEVALEDDEVGFREVLEQVGGFRVEVPLFLSAQSGLSRAGLPASLSDEPSPSCF